MTVAVLHAPRLHAVVHRVDRDRHVLSAEQCLHGDKHLLCQPFLYLWPLPHEQGAFGLGFLFAAGRVRAWVGSLRMSSSTSIRFLVALSCPCAAASL